MNRFQELVSQTARRIVREEMPIPTVQGYIPDGGINKWTWTCRVRYANPFQGMNPGQIVAADGSRESYLEAFNVPLPRSPEGFISAILSIVGSQDTAVLLGFQGGDLGKPHIIQFLNLVHGVDQQPKQQLSDRSNPSVRQFSTAVPPALPRPPMSPPRDPGLGSITPNLPPAAQAQSIIGALRNAWSQSGSLFRWLGDQYRDALQRFGGQ